MLIYGKKIKSSHRFLPSCTFLCFAHFFFLSTDCNWKASRIVQGARTGGKREWRRRSREICGGERRKAMNLGNRKGRMKKSLQGLSSGLSPSSHSLVFLFSLSFSLHIFCLKSLLSPFSLFFLVTCSFVHFFSLSRFSVLSFFVSLLSLPSFPVLWCSALLFLFFAAVLSLFTFLPSCFAVSKH